jgi:hypothetical protein
MGVKRVHEIVTSDHPADEEPLEHHSAVEDALGPLLRERAATLGPASLPSAVVGELIAIAEHGQTPLILYDGQPGSAALPARSVVDLHAQHIGKSVVLCFENGDPARPIVMGVIVSEANNPLDAAGQVEVDRDGERMIVSAKEQLVLRCGKASVTLTKAGKVIIEGSYISSRATGTHRIQGGSVQLN